MDYVVLANSIIALTYLTIIIVTNVVLSIVFHTQGLNELQGCRLKTVTIGIVFVVSLISFLVIIQLLPTSHFDVRPQFFSICVIYSFLVLNIVKEQENTFPIILNLTQTLRTWCRISTVIDILPQPVLPLQELNPRVLQNNSQDCRIIDLEDDGGVFMG